MAGILLAKISGDLIYFNLVSPISICYNQVSLINDLRTCFAHFYLSSMTCTGLFAWDLFFLSNPSILFILQAAAQFSPTPRRPSGSM